LLTSIRKQPDGYSISEGVQIDITDRKQAEVDKDKLEEQLQQAQKMESVGRLAGGVAHDFNNMLQVILGNTCLAIKKAPKGSSMLKNLMEINESANRSANLTRQLLAFARKQTIMPVVLDLNEVVTGILKMLKRLIGEDIDIEWIPGADIFPIKVDPSQIDQILANLCVNARDAIADIGKITIETGNRMFDIDYCNAHPDYIPGEYVFLSVSDNGCGMDHEILQHIFEPFFTTKDVGKGTGLGLSTVYGAIKQNNGFINVYSEMEIGTKFTFFLPRYAGKKLQTKTEDVETTMLCGQETVLVVEDESSILEMVIEMLQSSGYNTLAAGNPIEAIRLAEEYSDEINLVITDVVMPNMDGNNLSKHLLKLYPNLRCLFMSGYTSDVIANYGIMNEGVNFIHKPFSMIELTTKVRNVLS
jgi:nitrogen-specific signal transduction histidine kinase